MGPVFNQSGEFNHQWLGQTDIIYLTMYGILPIDVTKENSCQNQSNFVMETKAKLGAKAIGRRESENNEGYELSDPQSPYNRVFDTENCSLRLKNEHFWRVP